MGNRRKAREIALQVLYQIDAQETLAVTEGLRLYWQHLATENELLPLIQNPLEKETDVCAFAEQLVHETNALFFEPGDVAALAAALTRLACDQALRERMGLQSRVVLAGLKSFDEMVADYGTQFMEAREGL